MIMLRKTMASESLFFFIYFSSRVQRFEFYFL